MTQRFFTTKQSGFTIVELLIVIVVIAILAAISTVAYKGITERAIDSTLKQDISSANKQVEVYRATNGALPQADNCPSPGSEEVCLEGSGGTTFTYVTNGTSPPTSYQILATNRERSFISSDGSAAKQSYGNRIVTLTNAVQNGDFSAGKNGWSFSYCYSGSTCQVVDGMLKMISYATARINVNQNPPDISYTDGDEIFYSARVRKVSGSDFSINAQRSSGGYRKDILTEAQFNAAPTGELNRYSDVRNFVAAQGSTSTVLHINEFTSSVSSPFEVDIDDVVVLNLTATFGAGNEPSASEMDGILSQFENGWFSGTATATY